MTQNEVRSSMDRISTMHCGKIQQGSIQCCMNMGAWHLKGCKIYAIYIPLLILSY